VNAGKPGARWVSTRTVRASMPIGARLYSSACVTFPHKFNGL
jgi:hypothetical protein